MAVVFPYAFSQQIHATHQAIRIVLADFRLHKILVKRGFGLEIDPARRGQIALVGGIGAFAKTERLHHFGDHEVQVGVALPVGVRHHIDGHAVHAQADVGTVVEVEAAQKQLLGLAAARVLADEQPRHHAQDFLRVGHGPQSDVHRADDLLGIEFQCRHRHRSKVDGRGDEFYL